MTIIMPREGSVEAGVLDSITTMSVAGAADGHGLLVWSVLVLLGMGGGGLWTWRQQLIIKRMRNERLRSYLGRFLSPVLVEDVVHGRRVFSDGAEHKRVTVLAVDVPRFADLAPSFGPKNTRRYLQEFYESVCEVAFQNRGSVERYSGVSLSLIFGAPFEMSPEDQVRCAANAAGQILERGTRLQQLWFENLGVDLDLRIAIHMGEAIVGSFGNRKRNEFTAIGPLVAQVEAIKEKAGLGKAYMSEEVAYFLPPYQRRALGLFTLMPSLETANLFELIADTQASISFKAEPDMQLDDFLNVG